MEFNVTIIYSTDEYGSTDNDKLAVQLSTWRRLEDVITFINSKPVDLLNVISIHIEYHLK